MKGGSNRQRKIVDRESFIQTASRMRSPEDGKLTLVLGGKSVGKTLVVSHVAEQVRQAPGGNRTTLLVNMRQMPADDFYEATLSVASKQTNVLDILTQLPLFGKRFSRWTTVPSLAVHPATALHGDPAWGLASWNGSSGCAISNLAVQNCTGILERQTTKAAVLWPSWSTKS